jgi:DNA-binding transcriptional ArsR family regulator
LLAEHDLKLYQLKAELCKAFSDPRRLVIINELRHGEKTVSELVQLLGMPQAAVSRHLAILRDRGVVNSRRAGTSVYYRLADIKIIEACDLVHSILLDQMEKNRELANSLIV